eukprot:gene9019-10577_t
MQTGASGKKYGLQLPASKLKNAFGGSKLVNEDAELEKGDEEELHSGAVDYYKQRQSILGTKVQKVQDAALMEDPTAFEYDAVYDSMQKEKEKKTRAPVNASKPKYIQTLLEEATKKKKDLERVKERSIQREREAEGDMYKDKEVFLTSGYKKKLEEQRLEEEKEKKREEDED